jgi:hypothetical protein
MIAALAARELRCAAAARSAAGLAACSGAHVVLWWLYLTRVEAVVSLPLLSAVTLPLLHG